MAKNVYSVRQVNAYIKNMFVQDFMLNRIYVKGEVSNCKYHTSGHIYFSLKDETGAIACVMFAGERRTGLHLPYAGRAEGDGAGKRQCLRAGRAISALCQRDPAGRRRSICTSRYEQLKRELEEMGMFSAEYKQPIPFYNRKIGIVTAPTGAAIRDIHEYQQTAESLCAADPLPGSGAGRTGGGEHRQREYRRWMLTVWM